jgi:hypothetical protein
VAFGEQSKNGNGRIDMRIGLGAIINLVVMIIGGVWVFAQLQQQVNVLPARVDQQITALSQQIAGLRVEMIGQVSIMQAAITANTTRLDHRIDSVLEKVGDGGGRSDHR